MHTWPRVVATLEELGNDIFGDLLRRGEPLSAEKVHHEAMIRLFHRLADHGSVASIYERLRAWRPVLAADVDPERPFRLLLDRQRRKATGSFFTPSAVVGFLVEETLGPLVQGRSAADILRLRILDPAMGAGCFLLAAADFLARAATGRGGHREEWQRRVIEHCLFGMDIDPLAVELARRQLGVEISPAQLRCGDALETAWPGPFDAVLGNPPWGRCQVTPQWQVRFPTLQPRHANLSVPFTELGLRLSENGRLGFVLPSPWLEIESCRRLRRYLCSTRRIDALVLARQLFARQGGPAVDAVLLVVGGRGSATTLPIFSLDEQGSVADRLEQLQSRAWSETRMLQLTSEHQNGARLTSRERQQPFAGARGWSDFVHVRIGTQAYARGGGRPPQSAELIAARAYHADRRLDPRYVRFVPCGDVQRFRLAWSGGYLCWGDHLHCPRDRSIFTRDHLLLSRIFDVRRRVFKVCHVPGREDDFWCNNTDSFNIWLADDAPLTLFALLGLLGSRQLGQMAFEQFINLQRPVFPKVSVRMTRTLPLPNRRTLSSRAGKAHVAELDALVREITAEGLTQDREERLEFLATWLYGQPSARPLVPA